MSTVFIYALKEPDTGEIRYVGKSIDPEARLISHLSDREKNRRTFWIASLKAKGAKPVSEILDEVEKEYWQQWEVAWIEFFREQGVDLVNTTVGGDGCGAGADHPAFGRVRPQEERDKLSAAHLGKPKSPEAIKKSADARRGQKRSEGFCRKCSLGHLGIKRSKESIEKGSAALRRRERRPESYVKMAESRLGEKNRKRSSRFVGVFRNKDKWISIISLFGEQIYLGIYSSEEHAAHTYDWVARLYYGEAAKVNFP